jgi:putative N-acetyltransferase (TIGR04045 family)
MTGIQLPVVPPLRYAVHCRIASSADDLGAHWRVRHHVFVCEQLVFEGTDRDAWDTDDRTVHCVGVVHGRVVGAVRLYPVDTRGRRWQGDRLAVLPGFRSAGLGGPLVRLAVSIAKARGGQCMVAHVQLDRVRFFEYLGWHQDGPVEIHVGIPHQPMSISW